MDEHGQIGPEKPDYMADVVDVAKALEHDHVAHVAFTSTMSRWGLMLTPLRAINALGQHLRGVGPYRYLPGFGPPQRWHRLSHNGYMVLSIVEGHRLGCHIFAAKTWHSPDYVGMKLWGPRHNPVDALALSGFLNRIERTRCRLAGDDSMEQLEVWEWRDYETMERREGAVATVDRFVEITGCPRERAEEIASGKAAV